MLSYFYDAIAAYSVLKKLKKKKKQAHSTNTCVHQERFMQNYANQLQPELLSMCREVACCFGTCVSMALILMQIVHMLNSC